MSILEKLASRQDRRDEEPNKELGRFLVKSRDTVGIQVIAENLWNEDAKIQSDCDAVMEEIGHHAPELIAPYVFDFLRGLSAKKNRRVWQSMINLSLIAAQKPAEIFENRRAILAAFQKGSVITQDNGIKTLAIVAAADPTYCQTLFPFLIEQLQTCRSKSVPQYAESILIAIKPHNQEEYLTILKQRFASLSTAQQRRVKKIIKKLTG